MAGLRILDVLISVFHSALMVFNLIGWIWPSLRKWNLLTILLTFSSWTLLGVWFGWGYCPLTDFHYSILNRLGYKNLPPSYFQFIVQRLTGISVSTSLADAIMLWGLIAGAIGSLFTNARDYFRKKSIIQ